MNDCIELLGMSAAQSRAAGAPWTAREIAQQPQLWPQIARQIAADEGLEAYLTPLLGNGALRIVLTGAGTSAYIGNCLAPALSRAGRRAEAIPTTDIVASPLSALMPKVPTLMVHFARSGNSPESVAALELAERQIEHCDHLIITCNAEGELSRRAGSLRRGAYSVVLPETSNDRGFAMTSSFTGMLLAASLGLGAVRAEQGRIEAIAALGTEVLTTHVPLAASLVRAQFERVVFVGSNELKGLALESALKMLELTDGRVVSMAESPLGFRHGPKTIVNGSTLVVAFLSNDSYTERYDLDLLRELRGDAVAGKVVALTVRKNAGDTGDTVALGVNGAGTGFTPHSLSDLELCLPYIAFAQTLALLRSISLGLSPDTPNAAGTVNRVVQGVSIHPFPGQTLSQA